jgi:3-dehydroquinate dehydratase-2
MVQLHYFQSNHEGDLIDYLHEHGFEENTGIVLNAGAYTHTSIALRDAIDAIEVPVAEVHISDIYNREPFRANNYLKDVCKTSITGEGIEGYRMAIDFLLS